MNEVTNAGPASASPAHSRDEAHGKLDKGDSTGGQHFGSRPSSKKQGQGYGTDNGSDDFEAESLNLIKTIRAFPQLYGSAGYAVLKR